MEPGDVIDVETNGLRTRWLLVDGTVDSDGMEHYVLLSDPENRQTLTDQAPDDLK
jgi:hypothetical protein